MRRHQVEFRLFVLRTAAYISHFVCLYNFNYTGRPLRGPGIIGITPCRSAWHASVNTHSNNKIDENGVDILREI